MRRTNQTKFLTTNCRKTAGALLVVASLMLMVGCAGVSNGGSSGSKGSSGSGSSGSGSGGSGPSADAQLAVSPATLALGSVFAGSSGTASGTLNATGGSVTVSAASANNSAFSVSGLSLPVTIDSGKSVPFTVTFSPSAAGAASATLTFTSNAQTSTTAESLTGTGMAAPTHSVNLSWNPSSSSNISGYNIYRAVYASSCGSFAKINSTLNTSTLYTDAVVTDGTSYCYATTAVNSSNEESGYSNIVSPVAIPAP